MAENTLRGLSAAPGLAVGRARVLGGAMTTRETVPEARRPREVRRAHAALEAAAAELDALADRLGGDEGEIVRAGVLMAHDPVLVGDVERAVLDGLPAPAALEAGTTRHAAAIAALGDATLAARAEDVRSLGRRAIRLAEEGAEGAASAAADVAPAAAADVAPAGAGDVAPAAAADVILVAAELGPADVAELGPEVVGLALAGGGPTAHAAVVARGLGLPMVVGLGEEVLGATPGNPIVVDGGEGVAFVTPSAARAAAAAEAQAARRAERERALADRALPAVTRDGHRVRVLVNAATRAELDAGLAAGAEGVGLLRTELAFLEAAAWPTEAQHRSALAPVVSGLAGRTATVRVLDFGADKTPPFLAGTGERGLELLLARPEALQAQLRAIVDAGRETDLRILLPMVESADQVRAVRALLPEPAALGAMIETRAAVANAGEIAAAADFLSIGTNDLSHAVLGSDRFAGAAAPAHDPRVLAAMAAAARAAAAARVVLEVCGEAASEPASVPLLVGLGAGELSVGAARVGAVRGWIRALSHEEARQAAKSALGGRCAEDVAALGAALLQRAAGLGGTALLQGGDAAGERVERDGRVLAVGPEA
jgi:phosphoenolpyruvate-protein kinase (PTS system EI component)